MQTLLESPSNHGNVTVPCRACGASIDLGAKASLVIAGVGLALDCACQNCGKRALYHSPRHP